MKTTNPKRPMTWIEELMLRQHFADSRTEDLALVFGRSYSNVAQMAHNLGLRKSDAYLASPQCGRLQKGQCHEAMKASQFKPGLTPWNTGMKGWAAAGTEATRFKKGHRPQTWVPVGSYRISADGALERKVNDLPGPNSVRWHPVARLVWEAANGPVPAGHIVVFLPRRRTTVLEEITLDAVELITRAENARRNSIHTRYPKEVVDIIRLKGAIKAQITRRTRKAAATEGSPQ